jgi:GMP synthase-like glutamine amidotransferase
MLAATGTRGTIATSAIIIGMEGTMSPKPILELRHVESEPPGAYTPVLEKYAPIETARLWREPVPADPGVYSAIIVMGGPMGANDGSSIPWIDQEIELLRHAIAAGTPVWGVCLGAQLLAAALGADVYTGGTPEVGVFDLQFTGEATHDPVWGSHANGAPFAALQWHSDSFELPVGATLLASSSAYRNQLFRYGNSYGVQFHLEADEGLAKEWLDIEEYLTALTSTIGSNAVPGFINDIALAEPITHPMAVDVMDRWLQLVMTAS